MKEKRSKIREKLSLRAVGLILAMSMVAGTLLPVGVGAEELPIDINNEEITVADVMMYEDTDMSEDEEENEAAAETEEVIDVVSEENSEEAPAETSEPEAAEPETTESEVSESEVSEPEVTEPEVPDFEETEPDEIITEEELPADAPEEEIYFCGIEEHEHTEECRNAPEEPDGEIIVEEEIPEEEPQPEEEPGELYCGYEVHVHDDTCWNEEYLADCGMEEHEHSDNCYSLAYTLMAEFAAAVELFPNEADYILLDFDEADGSELLDEEAYYRAYAAFYEENPDIWATTDELFAEAEAAYAEENPDGDLDAWMQENGFWEAAEKFYQVVPTPEAVAEITAQYEVVEKVELEYAAEEDGMMLYGTVGSPSKALNTVVTNNTYENKTVVNREDSGITFRLFDYWTEDTNNDNKAEYNTGVNNNGLLGYFDFRGECTHNPKIGDTDDWYKYQNPACDTDGYGSNHATVNSLLQNGYPVFDTQNASSKADTSLGYLFGAGGNGVTEYIVKNTLLLQEGDTYLYDSANNAVDYDASNQEFILRTYKEQGPSSRSTGGDFFPFTYWDGEGESKHQLYDINYWFGMTMEASFVQLKDGKINDEAMEFKFSGDDDVWVFIDDVLVLDLGGTHGTVEGTINFATGEVKSYLSWSYSSFEEAKDEGYGYETSIHQRFVNAGKADETKWKDIVDENGQEKKIFADYTPHTIKFFYLERGSAVANCSLKFNLPTLPANSLTVTKNVEAVTDEGTSAEDVEYIKNLPYKFKVVRASDTSKLFIPAGETYTLIEGTTEIGTDTVDSNGYFYLQDGQSARFKNMEVYGSDAGEYSYIVQEFIGDELTGQYKEIEYTTQLKKGEYESEKGNDSGDFTTYDTPKLNAEDIEYVTYTNKINISRLSHLKITKEIAPGSDFDTNPTFDFEVKLGGELLKNAVFTIESGFEGRTTTSTDENGILTLYAVEQSDGTYVGEIATLAEGIVSGTTYEVSEIITDTKNLVFYDVTEVETNDGNDPVKTDRLTTDDSLDGHGVSGQFALASTVTVKATNSTYNVNDTVDLILTKMVTGNMGDRSKEFTFTVEMKLPNQPDPAAVFLSEAPTLYSVGSADDLPIIKDTNDIGSAPNNIISNITLKHGESYRIVGITKGATIRITEIPEGYTPTVMMGEKKLGVGKNDDGSVYVDVVVTVENSGGTITFTNDKTATIDTAVHLDYLPYILILTAVIPTMTLAVSRKRRRRED